MSTPKEHLRMQWDEVHRAEDDLATLTRLGVSEIDPAYLRLQETLGATTAKVGRILPRIVTWLASIFGFSPGIIKLWHDGDAGFVSEARVKPGDPPIYHCVSGEEAVAILKMELSPELHDRLFTPDPYIGE